MITKQRLPHEYFEFRGIGQSSDSNYPTAYHLALMDCGIETQNIMTYSSIIPGTAILVEKPKELVAGAVMESIMAVHHGTRSQTISAGLCYNFLFDENGNRQLGIVVERHGNYSDEAVRERLYASIYEIKNKSFSHLSWDEEAFKFLVSSFEVDEQHGTAICGLGFISYLNK